jgi:hypothetical protein
MNVTYLFSKTDDKLKSRIGIKLNFQKKNRKFYNYNSQYYYDSGLTVKTKD